MSNKHELEGSFDGNFKRQKQNQELDDIFGGPDLDVFLKDVSVPLVSSIEGTPEIENILDKEEKKIKQNNNAVVVEKSDIELGREFLREKYEELRDVNLARMLLRKKQEEDEGISEEESSDEDEDEDEDSDEDHKKGKDNEELEFEDLLEMFDINPEETSLELTLNEKRKLLIDSMNEKQLNRYEFFRRTNLNTGGIKKLVNSVTGVSVPNDFAKLLSGIGKVFVGEIIERAKQVQRDEAEARVGEQLRYKAELKENNVKPPPSPPSFYASLVQQETGASHIHVKRKIDASLQTKNDIKIVVPNIEESQLTPDHILKAWNFLEAESGAKVGKGVTKWRSTTASLF
jgi:transcription initiation factor TFIID subunit 11